MGVSALEIFSVSVARFPICVFWPVPKIIAFPFPLCTRVPEKTIFLHSSIFGCVHSSERNWGSDSPVMAELSTFKEFISIKRPSAGTLSPSSRRITSPTTSSEARISRIFPSLRALACGGRSCRKLSIVFATWYSCIKAKVLLRITTTARAIPMYKFPFPGSRYSPIKAKRAPIASSMEKKFLYCRIYLVNKLSFPISSRILGPHS